MENFEKLIIGFILFIVTSVLTYLFRMRQLYVVTPKLFKVTPVSQSGSLCEVIIYNRGNQVEEEINVNLESELKLELLASNSNELRLEKSTLSINRLHKGQEASALLLVENGVLDFSKIVSLTSKNTVGKPLKKVEEVPPNFAKLFLGIISFISIAPAVFYGLTYYEKYKKYTADEELIGVYALGWSNLSEYYYSELKPSYSNKEFPIRFLKITEEDKVKYITFEAFNKTAIPLGITVDSKLRPKNDFGYYKNITVAPMSKTDFTVKLPPRTNAVNTFEYEFDIEFGGDYIFNIEYMRAYE